MTELNQDPNQNLTQTDPQDDPLARLYPAQSTQTIQEAAEEVGAPQDDTVMDSAPASSSPKKRKLGLVVKVFAGLVILLALIASPAILLGFQAVNVARQLQVQASDLETTGRAAYDRFKEQDLAGAEEHLKQVAEKLKVVRTTYSQLWMFDKLPIAHGYYQDGIHGLNAADAGVSAGLKSLAAIAPYADVLGFKGKGSFTGGTAEDRLKLVLQTLEKVKPDLDNIAADLETVKTEMSEIDPQRYPEDLQGKPIRSYVQSARDLSLGASTLLTDFRPVIERLPEAAGSKKRKKYLVIFQNNNELRPTGGFLTAYAVIFVENGKVSLEKSDDIYSLDAKLQKKRPAIPEKLGKYLTTEKQWNLRDMNISPDFKTSMDQFLQYYKTLPDEPKDIDGIVAVDTFILTDLLKVLGPVEVPGYGTFTAENSPKCDCPQIIYALSEIITKPTPYLRQDRKGILGPMMRSILDKAYTAPKTLWPNLFAAAWANVQGRHAQVYFFDEETQKAAEVVQAAGRMMKDPAAEDFLAVVDANLGGAKSNLFIDYQIDQQISAPVNQQLTKKVTITYKNSRKGDNCNLEAGLLCLNARLRDWFRLYVPKGAKLVNSQGFRPDTLKQYDEGEFTVFDGEFLLDPLSQAKLILDYTVPYTNASEYQLKVWKQGGTRVIPMELDVNGDQHTLQIDKDTVFKTAF